MNVKQKVIRAAAWAGLVDQERVDRMQKIEVDANERAAATRERNRRDLHWLKSSGLDLPNLNATLFDARERGGGR